MYLLLYWVTYMNKTKGRTRIKCNNSWLFLSSYIIQEIWGKAMIFITKAIIFARGNLFAVNTFWANIIICGFRVFCFIDAHMHSLYRIFIFAPNKCLHFYSISIALIKHYAHLQFVSTNTGWRHNLKEYYEIFFIFTLEQIIVLNKYCT